MIQSIVDKFLAKPYLFKQGNKSIAKGYSLQEKDVKEARQIAKSIIKKDLTAEQSNYIATLEEEIVKRVDLEKGTLSSETSSTFDPKTVEELAELHKIDLKVYKISNYWSKLKSNGKFTSSVFCTLIKATSQESFREDFVEFLKGYVPEINVMQPKAFREKNGCLLLPQQDAHYNKYDIDGDNNIDKRFAIVRAAARSIVERASASYNLEQIVYVVGSDEFNSEWTGMTTKGTPQQNILSYQEAFKKICDHEVNMIIELLHKAENVNVVFIPGNHDEFVGWHLINWLETYFRNEKRVTFLSMESNTKYFMYGNTGVMLNHGDDMKPKDLAAKFPIGFKQFWSQCDYYHIFTGDKHTEQVVELGGIKIHRISQLSTSKGKWDDKKGFENKAEMTAFLITEDSGVGDIYKESL